QDHLDPALLDLAGEVGADVVVEPAQDVGAAIDQGGLDPQPGEDAGELHRDVAAAGHEDAFGQFGEVEGFLGADGVFDARQVVGDPGSAAGGDQDPLGGDRHLLGGNL